MKLGTLDHSSCWCASSTQASEQKLETVFRSFDTIGDGKLDRGELGRLLLQLMPDMDTGQVGVLSCAGLVACTLLVRLPSQELKANYAGLVAYSKEGLSQALHARC